MDTITNAKTADWLAAICIVTEREEATKLIKECEKALLAECLSALDHLSVQDVEFINKAKPRINELRDEIRAEISAR